MTFPPPLYGQLIFKHIYDLLAQVKTVFVAVVDFCSFWLSMLCSFGIQLLLVSCIVLLK